MVAGLFGTNVTVINAHVQYILVFQRVWGVAELYGRTQSVTAVSTCRSLTSPGGGGLPAGAAPESPSSVMQDSLELGGPRPPPGRGHGRDMGVMVGGGGGDMGSVGAW